MCGYRKIVPGIVILAIVLLSACGKQVATDNKLVILSPHQESITQEMTTGFQKWYKAKNGGDVELEGLDQGGTSNLIKFIRSEFEWTPDGISADRFLSFPRSHTLSIFRKGCCSPADCRMMCCPSSRRNMLEALCMTRIFSGMAHVSQCLASSTIRNSLV